MPKVYLGDSVYAETQERGVVLTTENGNGPSNTIYLEPETVEALTLFMVSQAIINDAGSAPADED